MKFVKFFSVSILLLGLSACGGKENSEGSENNDSEEAGYFTPETTDISGDLAGCYTVVDRKYKGTGDFLSTVAIELTRTDKDLPFDENEGELRSFSTHGSGPMINVGFGIEFLDKDGNIISKEDPSSSPYSGDEAVTLARLKKGDKSSIQFMLNKNEAKDVKSFRISSAVKKQEGKESKSSSSVSSSSSFDLEKEMKKAQKEYDEAYKKAQKEYNDAFDKAQKEYNDAFDKAQKDLGF